MVTMNADSKGLKPSPLVTITHVDSEGIHECRRLRFENSTRVKEGESTVSVFKDVENRSYYFRVGLEFVKIKTCPFCGDML